MTMDADQWQKVKAVFQAALDLPHPDRTAYVLEVCAGNDDLLKEVESLLDCEEGSSNFLHEAATEYVAGQNWDDVEEDPNIGRRIGHYQIVSEIGAGGMGSVYLAQRVDEFLQNVALKLMRRGMDSRLVISRFRYERQILAGLHHPNIARLLDGGATDDGCPYFVMEYVDGEPVDKYCISRALSIPELLSLFREICSAVQYAHQNLIIHRDIKPGNILVTADGTPILLDFGIAKLLRHEPSVVTSALTREGVRLMTPEYASPEQVRGVSVATGTDVYSLGVVLYQLLTGRLPYTLGTRSPTEIERVICEQDPAPPSAAVEGPDRIERRKRLSGDVDSIVLKALEKDVQRRYGSVEQFSEDIRRHLEGLPITARPHTLFYRARKFARRNRTAVVAAALVMLSLIAGLIATTWEAHIARQERARAERRFNDVRGLANTVLFDFHDRIKDIPGTTETRRLLVTKALEYLDSLGREAAGDTALELELAEAYVRLGDVQGNPYYPNIGDAAGALASYDKSVRIAEGVVGRDSRNPRASRTLAHACLQRGDVLYVSGRESDALASIRRAAGLLEPLIAAFPQDISFRVDLASSLEALGDVLGHPGLASLEDADAAAKSYRKSLDAWKEVQTRDPQNARAKRAVAVLTMKLGDLELSAERPEAAQELFTKALNQISETDLGNAENLRVAASIRRKLAYVLSYTDVSGALAQYQKSISGFEQLVAADPRNTRARMDLAVVLTDTGEVQESAPKGRDGAIATYRKVLDHLSVLNSTDPTNIPRKQMMADIHLRLGRLLAKAGNTDEARKTSARGLELGSEIARREGATTRQVAFYAEALLLVEPPELKKPDEALRFAQRASNSVHDQNPMFLDLMAEAHYQAGRAQQAIDIEKKALGLLPPESASRAQFERHMQRYRAASSRRK